MAEKPKRKAEFTDRWEEDTRNRIRRKKLI